MNPKRNHELCFVVTIDVVICVYFKHFLFLYFLKYIVYNFFTDHRNVAAADLFIK
jgi:hypothetical protein